MSLFEKIADRLVLQPSRNPIDPELREQHWIDSEFGKIEAWTIVADGRKPTASPSADTIIDAADADFDSISVDAIAIKFPGTGGRAERGGIHPFECWPNRNVEVWTINHAGYGGSSGKASLQKVAMTCEAVWTHVAERYPNKPKILVGNSLGCVSAMYLAARKPAAGIYLRNPVPIHQLISKRPRYNWWNFSMARFVANAIPQELNSVVNAANSNCPALFARSELDRLIPEEYQKMITDAYAGSNREFVIDGADHHHRVPEHQTEEYVNAIRNWLADLS